MIKQVSDLSTSALSSRPDSLTFSRSGRDETLTSSLLCLPRAGRVRPSRIQNCKSRGGDWIRYLQRLTLVTEHKGCSTDIEDILYAASVQHLPHHTVLPFLLPACEVTRGLTTQQPSFNLPHQKHLETIPRIPCSFSHVCQHVQVRPPFTPTHSLDSSNEKSVSSKSPPERGKWREEAERTLIWLRNTVQFAVGQWNSISFFPFWSISIWRVSTDFVFPQPSATCVHLQPSVRGHNQIGGGKAEGGKER